VTATTQENQEPVEELICSQEEQPGMHLSPQNISEELDVSHTLVRRMVKRKGIKQFK